MRPVTSLPSIQRQESQTRSSSTCQRQPAFSTLSSTVSPGLALSRCSGPAPLSHVHSARSAGCATCARRNFAPRLAPDTLYPFISLAPAVLACRLRSVCCHDVLLHPHHPHCHGRAVPVQSGTPRSAARLASTRHSTRSCVLTSLHHVTATPRPLKPPIAWCSFCFSCWLPLLLFFPFR